MTEAKRGADEIADLIALPDLVPARLQLHHAAQVVASAAVTLLPARPDDSHPNLAWEPELGALVGRALPELDLCFALRTLDATVLALDARREIQATLPLHGQTLDEAHAWAARRVEERAKPRAAPAWRRADYELPAHAVMNGSRFEFGDVSALAAWAAWFSRAQSSIAARLVDLTQASDLRCWPHHFDLGALQTLATNADGTLAKSIGIGWSPGDESYSEPYFYVSPWPYPAADALPPIAGGTWHTQGHTSAILTATALRSEPASPSRARIDDFLESAIDASRAALSS